jgi:hypothetical protein
MFKDGFARQEGIEWWEYIRNSKITSQGLEIAAKKRSLGDGLLWAEPFAAVCGDPNAHF